MTILRKINQFMEDLYSARILKNKANYQVQYWKYREIGNDDIKSLVSLEINLCRHDRHSFEDKVEQVEEALNDEFPNDVIYKFIPKIKFGSIEILFKRCPF